MDDGIQWSKQGGRKTQNRRALLIVSNLRYCCHHCYWSTGWFQVFCTFAWMRWDVKNKNHRLPSASCKWWNSNAGRWMSSVEMKQCAVSTFHSSSRISLNKSTLPNHISHVYLVVSFYLSLREKSPSSLNYTQTLRGGTDSTIPAHYYSVPISKMKIWIRITYAWLYTCKGNKVN